MAVQELSIVGIVVGEDISNVLVAVMPVRFVKNAVELEKWTATSAEGMENSLARCVMAVELWTISSS